MRVLKPLAGLALPSPQLKEHNGQPQIGAMRRLAAASIGAVEFGQIESGHGLSDLPRQMIGWQLASTWRQGADGSFQGGSAKQGPGLVACKGFPPISLASSGCAQCKPLFARLYQNPKGEEAIALAHMPSATIRKPDALFRRWSIH